MSKKPIDTAFQAAATSAAAETGAPLANAESSATAPATDSADIPPATDTPPTPKSFADMPPAPAKRGPGRPPGRKTTRPHDGTAAPARTSAGGASGLSKEDALASAEFLLKYLDRTVAMLAKTPELKPDELSDGAHALAPVLKKYLGNEASPEALALVWALGCYAPRVFDAYQKRRGVPGIVVRAPRQADDAAVPMDQK